MNGVTAAVATGAFTRAVLVGTMAGGRFGKPGWSVALGSSVGVENMLDAADFGVPQHRKRLFVAGVHKGAGVRPLVISPGDSPHVPALTVLVPNASNWSPILKPGRALDTVRRIIRGRRQFGDNFLVAYFGKEKGGRDLHRLLGTVLTRDRYALIDGPRMRMLTANEYRSAMGFGDNYRLPDNHRLAVSLLGNAVCPPVAKHVCQSITTYRDN